MIPYGKHSIDAEDVAAVVNVLEHQFLTQGQQVPAFEQALCAYTKSSHCIAVNSGTSALHITCLAAGIGSGDTVWTVPNSFVASANCALYCGATVDFVDIEPKTRNLDVESLRAKLKHTEADKIPKLLVVVHFAGVSCDMQTIREICNAYDIIIVEDASHALGATYQNLPVGGCQYSDMTVFSFHPVKSVTTAEGGAVMTNSAALASRLAKFSKHGTTRDKSELQDPENGDWFYEQQLLGYNYRLSDLHAALGIAQLKKLPSFIEQRKQIAKRYDKALIDLPIKKPWIPDYCASAWHLYVVELIEHDRKQVFKELRAKGIGVNVHYIPIHIQPYYRDLGFNLGDFPNSEKYYDMALSLPIYPGLSESQQQYVVDTLKEVLN